MKQSTLFSDSVADISVFERSTVISLPLVVRRDGRRTKPSEVYGIFFGVHLHLLGHPGLLICGLVSHHVSYGTEKECVCITHIQREAIRQSPKQEQHRFSSFDSCQNYVPLSLGLFRCGCSYVIGRELYLPCSLTSLVILDHTRFDET